MYIIKASLIQPLIYCHITIKNWAETVISLSKSLLLYQADVTFCLLKGYSNISFFKWSLSAVCV